MAGGSSAGDINDVDAARLTLKEVLGDIAKQDVEGKPPTADVIAVTDPSWFSRRKQLLASRHVELEKWFEQCQALVASAGLTADQSASACHHPDLHAMEMDMPVVRQLLVEGLAPLLPEAEAKAARERVATTFGWEHGTGDVRAGDHRAQVVAMTERPMSGWRMYELKLAAAYAKAHSLEAEKDLDGAIAAMPAFKCTRTPVVVAKDYEGSGRYGKIYYADRIAIQQDGHAWWGEVPCAKVPKTHGESTQYLTLIQAKAATTVSVERIASEDWRVFNNDAGIPESKRLVVLTYDRVAP